MAIDRGAQVRQVVPVIQGEVLERRFNEDGGCLEYLVAYTDADGNPAQRWFLETQVQEVTA